MTFLLQQPAGMRRAACKLSQPPLACRQFLVQRERQPLQFFSSFAARSAAITTGGRARGTHVAQARCPAPWRGYATTGEGSTLAGPDTPSPIHLLSNKIWRDTLKEKGSRKGEKADSEPSSSSPSSSSWPDRNPKYVGYFLLGSAASVFGIVVFGGLTRLTESGLSITEWKPVTGSLPPMSQADWGSEFEKYRASPEFKVLNSHMDLDEFKKIYYMEWTHRLWGRLIGVTFVVPTVYLIARRRVTRRMAAALVGISALIGFQGLVGWWMVKSGLKDDLFAPGSHPRVSQYRLTAHLGTAFVCYSCMLLAGLSVRREHGVAINLRKALARSTKLRTLRRAAAGLTALVFVTALSGALVAGLDAGLIYNEFPWMGGEGRLAPPKAELLDPRYSRRDDKADLWWRNALENPSLVQLDHRILAITTYCCVTALFWYSRRRGVRRHLPPPVRRATWLLLGMANLQVVLGLGTLLYMVPTHLAATHQAGALALLTGALMMNHRLRVSRPMLKAFQRKVHAGAPGVSRGEKRWG